MEPPREPGRCASLRWKGLFVETEWDPTVQRSGDRPCWCLHTQICFGPDGNLVNERECTPARSCYKPL